MTIAVPTYHRPDGIARLLRHLAPQVRETCSRADVRVLVVDNGPDKTTQEIIRDLAVSVGLPVEVVVEASPGIPAARNACIRAADGSDALILLDDDEWPAHGWLAALIETWRHTGADIVHGPAKGVLPEGAPRWASRSGIFRKDRSLTTGTPIRTPYSYNTLVSKTVLGELGPTFDQAFRFTGSSDRHYFMRARLHGFRAVWCAEALVYEEIPRERLALRWVLRRGLRTGGGAALSTRMLYPPVRRTFLIGGLIAFNVVVGFVNIIGTTHPRFHAVEGARRWAIAAGLVGGAFGWIYEEYARREEYK